MRISGLKREVILENRQLYFADHDFRARGQIEDLDEYRILVGILHSKLELLDKKYTDE
jgi:hypothetical protein